MSPIHITEADYRELNKTASHLLARERPGHVLQPEALVHEAWLRLANRTAWEDGAHFRAAAARHMRNILIDQGRRNASPKHYAGARVALNEVSDAFAHREILIPEIFDLLDRLRLLHPSAVRVVELKVFGGLSMAEIARALRSSPTTVCRLWCFARTWLRRRLA